ncbi:Ribosomal 50S subunit-recycling heat shock protein, contains S4 domain [Desulfonispora thiosulfatigenes DSM 11270]|uniref:RQC P-site tRNA stabilizing factor n=1 Tax=Desulfonispora thiosulfatigenes DSM 11270 TaxID=656914 RepID=A0A1W1V090_DESTI|nr:RNA-binding S4 domain-containing protein [Desulfonispora thiosulfatigenes]SMB86431.1 Ribosomal 50S subunit-recycling heat shock protein, contains S4 domain [Desulfonispora thiosulfatigenes DSM 11270]
MRIDKFLKVSRLIKRRTLAKEVCDGGRVKINENVAKAGSNVSVGDIIEISIGARNTKVKVLGVKENVRADQATELYELL